MPIYTCKGIHEWPSTREADAAFGDVVFLEKPDCTLIEMVSSEPFTILTSKHMLDVIKVPNGMFTSMYVSSIHFHPGHGDSLKFAVLSGDGIISLTTEKSVSIKVAHFDFREGLPTSTDEFPDSLFAD